MHYHIKQHFIHTPNSTYWATGKQILSLVKLCCWHTHMKFLLFHRTLILFCTVAVYLQFV